jgi:hypothetical protein
MQRKMMLLSLAHDMSGRLANEMSTFRAARMKDVRHFHRKLGGARAKGELQLGENGAARGRVGAEGPLARVHRQRRPRRSLPGMRLHMDGSTYQWFSDQRWDDLLVILDDATRKCELFITDHLHRVSPDRSLLARSRF